MAENRIRTLIVQAPAGSYYFSRSELAFATILKVTRNTQVQYSVSAAPTGSDPKYMHSSTEGKLTFSSDNPFNFAVLNPDGSRVIEYVTILYKRGGAIYVEGSGPSENP
ncbi:MAG: hypothetical protein JNK14_05670 [Chitinophagaceae bacterium]|nr:hypothetical protein [Chitinophagaceae bacterium]